MKTKLVHHELQVVHSIPGRIRLKSHKLKGHPRHALEVSRRLAVVQGIHKAEANPTTGSITMRYHPSVLDSVKFFAEITAALGLVAADIEAGEVEALFDIVGVSSIDIFQYLWSSLVTLWEGTQTDNAQGATDKAGPAVLLPLAFFVLGFVAGRWVR
jgi:hypothetical protein